MSERLVLPRPCLVFIADVSDPRYAKTAKGLIDWVPEHCVGEWALPGNPLRLGLPVLDPAAARARGARSLVIGVAPVGGRILDNWVPALVQALEAGLDLVSGMHTPLAGIAALAAAAERRGRRLIDLRIPPSELPVASGRPRPGRRLLTVGSDCAVGKKYTALALTRALRERGLNADFRASGQTGILIAGQGLPIDAVKADFIAGAAELLSPVADPDHWDVIEGQGSLVHPGYAAVSLGLLSGSQPDVLVLCHEAGRSHVSGYGPQFPLPPLAELIELNLAHARLRRPGARCAGISLNTGTLSAVKAEQAMAALEQELGLPVVDPVRGGTRFVALVEACLALRR
ncbi:DUF1611 domain-containing protein [Wenzhouxiangella limi]|uniref:DUF1611 domain-containing protein n=1 Tax=Wenzhouxiangella limi TaxID=2707351 RepID=A0A845V6P4_9GAMM|nr:DUF1611 domain-containing protein [Wenzhouxiangella limi]NDY96836.1 DUF1611 domain-containing protein [Wenzhouxiangella limi]